MWADLHRETRTTIFFVILVTHPKSYRETTDHRDFGGKPSRWGEDGCYGEKFWNFVAWVEPDPKTAFFAFSAILHTAYRKQFYPKPVVPIEIRDSEGVPFASLESL